MAVRLVGSSAHASCRHATGFRQLASARCGVGVRHILQRDHSLYNNSSSLTEAPTGDIPGTFAMQGDETMDGVPGEHGEAS